jgi:hypothetical protein
VTQPTDAQPGGERHLTDEDLGPVLRGEALPNGPLPKQPCHLCGHPTVFADAMCGRCHVVTSTPAA